MQNVVKPAPLIKPCMILGVTLFLFMMGKSAKYIRVLRVYPTMLQLKFSAC